MPRYSLSIRPSSTSHLADPEDATRTLCGLDLAMFGAPIRPEYEAFHVHCRSCDRALAAARRVRSALIPQEAR